MILTTARPPASPAEATNDVKIVFESLNATMYSACADLSLGETPAG